MLRNREQLHQSITSLYIQVGQSVIGNKTCPTPSHVEQSVDQPLPTCADPIAHIDSSRIIILFFRFKNRPLIEEKYNHIGALQRNFRNWKVFEKRAHEMANDQLNWFISFTNRFRVASYRVFVSPTHAIKEVARFDNCRNIVNNRSIFSMEENEKRKIGKSLYWINYVKKGKVKQSEKGRDG